MTEWKWNNKNERMQLNVEYTRRTSEKIQRYIYALVLSAKRYLWWYFSFQLLYAFYFRVWSSSPFAFLSFFFSLYLGALPFTFHLSLVPSFLSFGVSIERKRKLASSLSLSSFVLSRSSMRLQSSVLSLYSPVYSLLFVLEFPTPTAATALFLADFIRRISLYICVCKSRLFSNFQLLYCFSSLLRFMLSFFLTLIVISFCNVFSLCCFCFCFFSFLLWLYLLRKSKNDRTNIFLKGENF